MFGSEELRERLTAAGLGVVAAFVFIALASLLFREGFFADLLLDRNSTVFPYPFTMQNGMWVLFGGAAGELWVRFQRGGFERAQLEAGLLPEDEETMLRARDLGPIRSRCRGREGFFLQRVVSRCVLQFQSSRSTDRTRALLDSSLNLMQHEVDSRYAVLRYVVWVIPTIGFIGTVVGIAAALGRAGAAEDFQDPALLSALTRDLGVAFYTTMLALIQSAILVLGQTQVQAREEGALNQAGQYCLDNLINRLYEK